MGGAQGEVQRNHGMAAATGASARSLRLWARELPLGAHARALRGLDMDATLFPCPQSEALGTPHVLFGFRKLNSRLFLGFQKSQPGGKKRPRAGQGPLLCPTGLLGCGGTPGQVFAVCASIPLLCSQTACKEEFGFQTSMVLSKEVWNQTVGKKNIRVPR